MIEIEWNEKWWNEKMRWEKEKINNYIFYPN